MTLLADRPSVAPEPEAPALPTRVPRPSWFRGWRVPFRLARRDIARRPGRTVLVVLLMALPVAVMTLLDINFRRVDVVTGSVFADVRADASVYVGTECIAGCSPAEVAALLPPGSTVDWATTANLPVRTASMSQAVYVTVVVVEPGSTPSVRNPLRGRWPTQPGEVAMEQGVARALGLQMGASFRLAHQASEFTLVGQLRDSDGDLLVAPGFDLGVVRPEVQSRVGFVDFPAGVDLTEWWPKWGEAGLSVTTLPESGQWNYERTDVARSLVLGWLGGVLGMSVLGVVVASAFAISGRRQLVMLGQLSASGADQRTVTRTLGLLGTVTAAFGVVLGFVVAAGVQHRWPRLFGGDGGQVRVVAFDLVVIAVTALAVATVAALAPTRSLARVSVLAALAGRRPVGSVPPGVVRSGAALFAGGLLIALIATRSGVNGGGSEAGMLAALGMICSVLGVCMLSPALVDRFAGLAARAGGSLRLAARGVARHRPRAAAVLASLLLLGMGATGVAAMVEHNIAKEVAEPLGPLAEQRNDVVWARALSTRPYDASGLAVDEPVPLTDESGRRAAAEEILGRVEWTPAAVAYDPDQYDPTMGLVSYMVASDAVLDLYGASAEHRALIADSDHAVQLSRAGASQWDDQFIPIIDAPELQMYAQLPFISESAARARGLTIVPDAFLFGRADHSLTEREATAITRLSDTFAEAMYYSDGPDEGSYASWDISQWPDTGPRLTHNQIRLILLAVSLLLVTLVVAFGMALWAVEGRDERDVLVAVGASPSTMARVAGWRAGGLTFAAMVVAVPMGLFVSWMVSRAAKGDIVVPWSLMVLLIFAVPAVIGAGAWLSSAVAQRARPVRMSTLTAD